MIILNNTKKMDIYVMYNYSLVSQIFMLEGAKVKGISLLPKPWQEESPFVPSNG